MAKTRTNGFTLIEMLVVIVIIGILIGLSVPAVTTLMKSGGVSAASRHVSSTLSLARQYAITHRVYARVVFPYTTPVSQQDMRYRTYAVVTNRDNTVAAGWGYVTKWEYLPPGAVFLNKANMLGPGTGALDDSSSCISEAIPFPSASSPLTMLAYIEFNPTGASTTPAVLAIGEGFTSGGALTLTGSKTGTNTLAANLTTVSVDSLVGRIQVARP